MHVMRNLGKWKMPISRIFGVPPQLAHFRASFSRSAHSAILIIFYGFICLMLTDASCAMRCCIGSFVIYFIPANIYVHDL